MLADSLQPIAYRGSRRFAIFPLFVNGDKITRSRRMPEFEYDSEKDLIAEEKDAVARRVAALELLLQYAITQRLKRSRHIIVQGSRNLIADFLAGQSLN